MRWRLRFKLSVYYSLQHLYIHIFIYNIYINMIYIFNFLKLIWQKTYFLLILSSQSKKFNKIDVCLFRPVKEICKRYWKIPLYLHKKLIISRFIIHRCEKTFVHRHRLRQEVKYIWGNDCSADLSLTLRWIQLIL